MKAIGMYIFGGSQTIGHLLEGWKINTILEMTEQMLEQNAYHFVKNYPNISVKKPSEWQNNDYLNSLKNENYDLLFANPPCSGLSSINRNASANNAINVHLYEVIDVVNTIEPKVFFIENAPTLTSIGLPILKDMSKKLTNYKLLIINDCAKNHNVPMHRRRTFVIGYHKKYFNKLPKINDPVSTEMTSEIALSDVNLTYNKEFLKDSDETLFNLYANIKPGDSLFRTYAEGDYDIDSLPDKIRGGVKTMRNKLQLGQNAWDKSPCRMKLTDKFPSFTSLTRLIHPIENRDLYIREYAHIMGYPDDFIFYPDCKVNPVQCIAQGVPVNFIRYISNEIKNSFTTNEFIDGNIIYINQTNPNNIKTKIYYNTEEFLNANTIYG